MSSKNTHFTEEDLEKFDWLTLRKDMDAALPIETFTEKFIRKFKENPFVPIGCAATTIALSYGVWCLGTGKRKMSQYMMRTRVVAQGFTILAMVAGVTMTAQKNFKI
ncbi:HIG1 domain family member 2A, mitochondrial [Leptinotarsa decemlineata]|uniref:HIG1 domain family member 2A, mitochondrial n=1 Tax=Leptinotarsa decemlineata TaxID=7539 RepID=UPI000C255679|nr:HIG1 domain family member 2A, mitochondrial [Leptinotarsa decemlineata]